MFFFWLSVLRSLIALVSRSYEQAVDQALLALLPAMQAVDVSSLMDKKSGQPWRLLLAVAWLQHGGRALVPCTLLLHQGICYICYQSQVLQYRCSIEQLPMLVSGSHVQSCKECLFTMRRNSGLGSAWTGLQETLEEALPGRFGLPFPAVRKSVNTFCVMDQGRLE